MQFINLDEIIPPIHSSVDVRDNPKITEVIINMLPPEWIIIFLGSAAPL